MSDVKNENLTISMSGRRPVKIKKDEWDILAEARDWEGEHEFQAFRKWYIKVRQKEDKFIVYGGFDTAYRGQEDIRAGYLVDDFTKLESFIEKVGGEINASDGLIRRAIADLPAEEI
jgi:hypothetical protein